MEKLARGRVLRTYTQTDTRGENECVFVALGIQYANRMCCIILLSVACLAVPHFPTLSHKCLDFREKDTAHKMSLC